MQMQGISHRKKQQKARQATENDHNLVHHLPIHPCTVEPAVATNIPENNLGMSWMFLAIVYGYSCSILYWNLSKIPVL